MVPTWTTKNGGSWIACTNFEILHRAISTMPALANIRVFTSISHKKSEGVLPSLSHFTTKKNNVTKKRKNHSKCIIDMKDLLLSAPFKIDL